MPYCVAPDCKNRSFSKSKIQCEIEARNKTTFHLFPKNNKRRRIWIERMGLMRTSIPKYAYVCSCHFSPESFDRMSAFKVRLKDDAIPNFCSQKNAVLQDTSSVDKKREYSEATECCLVDNIALHPEAVESSSLINGACESANKQPRIDSSSTDCNHRLVFCQTPQPPRCVDKATSVSKSLIANSPTTQRLRNVIKKLTESHRKEIKRLKQTARRAQKRIATFKDVMTALRKQQDLNFQELEIFTDIGTSNAELVKQVIRKAMHETVPN